MHGYPSNLMNSNFLNKKRIGNCFSSEYNLQELDNGPAKEVNLVNKWLLTPAVVGTAAYYLMYLLFKGEKRHKKKQRSKVELGAIAYTGITTVALTLYLYNVLLHMEDKLLQVYVPVTNVVMLSILFYAAVYTWVYLLDPNSFKVDTQNDIISEIITFLYFSATNFVTAGGDVAPVSNTARILVTLQVLFFEFSFTLGLIFFIV